MDRSTAFILGLIIGTAVQVVVTVAVTADDVQVPVTWPATDRPAFYACIHRGGEVRDNPDPALTTCTEQLWAQ